MSGLSSYGTGMLQLKSSEQEYQILRNHLKNSRHTMITTAVLLLLWLMALSSKNYFQKLFLMQSGIQTTCTSYFQISSHAHLAKTTGATMDVQLSAERPQ